MALNPKWTRRNFMSSLGVVEITAVDDHELARSDFVAAIRNGYESLVNSETAGSSGSRSEPDT